MESIMRVESKMNICIEAMYWYKDMKTEKYKFRMTISI